MSRSHRLLHCVGWMVLVPGCTIGNGCRHQDKPPLGELRVQTARTSCLPFTDELIIEGAANDAEDVVLVTHGATLGGIRIEKQALIATLFRSEGGGHIATWSFDNRSADRRLEGTFQFRDRGWCEKGAGVFRLPEVPPSTGLQSTAWRTSGSTVQAWRAQVEHGAIEVFEGVPGGEATLVDHYEQPGHVVFGPVFVQSSDCFLAVLVAAGMVNVDIDGGILGTHDVGFVVYRRHEGVGTWRFISTPYGAVTLLASVGDVAAPAVAFVSEDPGGLWSHAVTFATRADCNGEFEEHGLPFLGNANTVTTAFFDGASLRVMGAITADVAVGGQILGPSLDGGFVQLCAGGQPWEHFWKFLVPSFGRVRPSGSLSAVWLAADDSSPGSLNIAEMALNGPAACDFGVRGVDDPDGFPMNGPALVDVTGDGLDDIIRPNHNDADVLVSLGDGGFVAQRLGVAPERVDLNSASVRVLDLDGDGWPDYADSRGAFLWRVRE